MMTAAAEEPSRRIRRGLDALNFFLADVRDGLGPYLAIYLLAVRGPDQGWNEATIGLVITLSAVAGLLAQTPAGALIDRSRHKRAIVIAAAVAVTASCVVLPFIGNFYAVAATQSVAGIAGAIFPPALAAITLGIVGPRAFSRRVGRNEAFNHAGNAVSAALAAGLAVLFGPVVVFWIMGALAAASIAAMLMIAAAAIDDDVARGLEEERGGTDGREQPSAWQALLTCRPLLIFAGLMATFHLATAAMLPTVGQKLTHVVGKDYATSLIAGCIVGAQCVMVPVAMLVGARADVWGRKPIFLVAFGVLAARGALHRLRQPVVAARRAAAGRRGRRHLRGAVPGGGGGPHAGHGALQCQPGGCRHRAGAGRGAQRDAGGGGDRRPGLFGRLPAAGRHRPARLPRLPAGNAGNRPAGGGRAAGRGEGGGAGLGKRP